MPRSTPLTVALLLVLSIAGSSVWPVGPGTGIFVPIDALVAEKRYAEAIDMLRGLLISDPSRTNAVKERIAQTQLREADDQINSQRYNEALSSLSLFWTQNPERADQAQKRIRMINQVRAEYNKKAQELLVFMGDVKNRKDRNYNQNILLRLQELDNLDRNNPDSKKTITGLKGTSLALVNQDTMKVVMSSGRKLIDAREYAIAAREYLKGLDLFKPEFENAGYDELTMQAVASEADKAAALPDGYEASQAGLEKAVALLGVAFDTGSAEKVGESLPGAIRALDELRGLRTTLFAAGDAVSRVYNSIPKEGKSPIEYQYLAYLDIFLRGRPDAFGPDKKPEAEKGKPEGIGGVLLAQTGEILDKLGKSVQASVEAAYSEAEAEHDAAAYSKAGSTFSRAAALAAAAAQVLGNWALIPESDFIPDLADLRSKIEKGMAAKARVTQLASLAAAGERLSLLAERSTEASSESAAYIARLDARVPLQDAMATLVGYRASILAIEASVAAESAGKSALAVEASATASGAPSLAAYATRLDKVAASALSAEFASAAARGRVEGDYMGRELVARAAALTTAEGLIDGLPSQRPERSRAGYRDPSPTGAIFALGAEEPKLAALASWIAGEIASMAKENPPLAADPLFSAARSRILELATETGKLQERRAADIAKASEKQKGAKSALASARDDMDASKLHLADAKSLIAQDKGKGSKVLAIRKDFANAQDSLGRSLAGIIESSNQDFDAKAWDDFQTLYLRTSAELGQSKKEYVIDETFRLLDEGQTYYDQGLFDLASESLNEAQDLWRGDNESDQQQVRYWQNLVRQASDTNNKREVRQSDALYYDIGNYLSEARRLYRKGDALAKSGRPAEAAPVFEAARQIISYITRAFPLNAEAGLLTLQILKSTDADAYRKSLPRRLQEAVALLATDASSGYSRLADLYKMEPGYPGLKATFESAEIKVGKRRAPPTRQELADAASFLTEAEKLLKTGRKDDASKAESDLNASLSSDPTNKKALALLRDLKTLQGKTAGLALGLADQAVLDQATRSFAASQYNQAREQLSQLLTDPGKRTREALKLDNDLKTLGY